LRLIKRYTMLPLIFPTLTLVPFEANITHMYIVSIMLRNVNIYGPNDRNQARGTKPANRYGLSTVAWIGLLAHHFVIIRM
jgi:hypothetical protein